MNHAAELAICGTEELRDRLESSEEFPGKLKAVVCVRISRRRVAQKPSDSIDKQMEYYAAIKVLNVFERGKEKEEKRINSKLLSEQ